MRATSRTNNLAGGEHVSAIPGKKNDFFLVMRICPKSPQNWVWHTRTGAVTLFFRLLPIITIVTNLA
jgi:hypothetical protein